MPCDNVTETIQAVFNSSDRLISYRLWKQECGESVGDPSLLLPRLKGKTLASILSITPESIVDINPPLSAMERFISLKHLFAIKSVLESLTGMRPGGPKAACAIAEINYDNGNLIVDADISVSLVTDQIKACGLCGHSLDNL
jgi:hypothetical protein